MSTVISPTAYEKMEDDLRDKMRRYRWAIDDSKIPRILTKMLKGYLNLLRERIPYHYKLEYCMKNNDKIKYQDYIDQF